MYDNQIYQLYIKWMFYSNIFYMWFDIAYLLINDFRRSALIQIVCMIFFQENVGLLPTVTTGVSPAYSTFYAIHINIGYHFIVYEFIHWGIIYMVVYRIVLNVCLIYIYIYTWRISICTKCSICFLNFAMLRSGGDLYNHCLITFLAQLSVPPVTMRGPFY